MRPHRLAQLFIALVALLLVRGVFFPPGWLAFDDLIPFMHADQIWEFLTASWNDYYQWPEVRGRYSVLGTPFRYLPLVPVGLLLGSLLAGLGAYRLTAYVQRAVGGFASPLGPLAAALFYLFIVFASKAHQVHTLFLGSALLPWTLLAFLRAVDPSAAVLWRRRALWAALTAVLLAINPAIHLVLLGYGALTALALAAGLTGQWKETLWAWGIVTLFGLLPYGLWLQSGGPGLTTAATASVPPELLEAWSGPFLQRFLLPMGLSLPETYRAGNYVFIDDLFARYPLATALFAIFPALALWALWRFRRRSLAVMIGLLWLGAVLMATGVYYRFSGYRLLIALTELPGLLAAPAQITLAVLRNPDRWLLLGVLMLAVLAGLGLSIFWRSLARLSLLQRNPALRALFLAVIGSAFLAPFAAHPAFRPLFTGDLGGVLRPAPLPPSYREALTMIDREKTLYLPLMGSRPLRWNFSKKTQDEALALLHGGPSMEGVTGSPLLNQLYLSYAYYKLLYRQAGTALGRYLSLGGFRYLLFHDDVENPLWPEEFERVRRSLEDQRDLELRYEGGDVRLYENASFAAPEPVPLQGVIAFDGSLDELYALLESGVDPARVGLLHVGEGDLDWETFARWAEPLGPWLIVYSPGNEDDLLLSLLAGSERAGAVAYPELGWGEEALRWWDYRWLNISAFNFVRFQERYGRFGVEGAHGYKLAATVEEGAEVPFELATSRPGSYALFLRAYAPQGARVALDLDGLYRREVFIEPFDGYRFLRVDTLYLKSGRHRLTVKALSNAPVVLNLAYVIPTAELQEYQGRFDRLIGLVSRARSLEEIEALIDGLPELPKDPQNVALLGYYGSVYWEERELEWTDSGGRSGRATPKRSWLIGHLYELPEGVSAEALWVRTR